MCRTIKVKTNCHDPLTNCIITINIDCIAYYHECGGDIKASLIQLKTSDQFFIVKESVLEIDKLIGEA